MRLNNRDTRILRYVSVAAFGLVAISAFGPVANAKETARLVDCDAGESVADALKGAEPHRDSTLVVTIRGTCNEAVSIVSDDVTLRGKSGPGSDGINGQITIDGGDRVVIDMLALSGAPYGVRARNGASVTVSNSTITSFTQDGIRIDNGAIAYIDNNTITVGGAGRRGVIVADGSFAGLVDNTIGTANDDAAVAVFRSASVRLLGGNSLTSTNAGTTAEVLVAGHSATIRQDDSGGSGIDVITAPATTSRAVHAFNLSTVDLRNFALTGNARVGDLSSLRVSGPGTIDGAIGLAGSFSKALLVSGSLGPDFDGCSTGGSAIRVCGGF